MCWGVAALVLSAAAAAGPQTLLSAEAGHIRRCGPAAAAQLLWGLAVLGSLDLEVWDALAQALDRPSAELDQGQLAQVGPARGGGALDPPSICCPPS